MTKPSNKKRVVTDDDIQVLDAHIAYAKRQGDRAAGVVEEFDRATQEFAGVLQEIEESTIQNIAAAAEARASDQQRNLTNLIKGIKSGALTTTPALLATTLTYPVYDGSGPIGNARTPRLLRAAYAVAALVYWGIDVPNDGRFAAGRKLGLGTWINKTQLAALGVNAAADFVVIFKNSSGTTIPSQIIPALKASELAPGATKTIGTCTVKVAASVGDWVYLTTSGLTMPSGTQSMTVFCRVQGVTAAGTLDYLLPAAVLDTDSTLPYAIYPESAYDGDPGGKVKALEAVVAGVADAAIPLPPLSPPVMVNASKDRYSGNTAVTSSKWKCARPGSVLSYVYNDAVKLALGETNTVKLVGVEGVNSYQPVLSHLITLADLADIGVIPDDATPPTISMRALYVKASVVNSPVRQIFFCLRYGGDSTLATYNAATDVNLNSGASTGSMLGAGDALWNHTSVTVDDALTYGFIHRGVKVPATYKGQPLTCIRINWVPNPASASIPVEYEVAGVSVVKGSVLDSAVQYFNKPGDQPRRAVAETDLTPELAVKVNASAGGGVTIKTLNLASASKRVIIGDSFSACHYALTGKAYICRLSEQSDWNYENYSTSGFDYQELNNQVRGNVKRYHASIGIKEYNATDAVLISNANDSFYKNLNENWYIDNLRGLSETVEALGLRPIVSTEFGSGAGAQTLNLAALRAFADQRGYPFIDIVTKSALVNPQPVLGRLWANGHPGTRTTFLFADRMLPVLEGLGRPRQSVKVFRQRTGVANTDLLYDDISGRNRRWQEILPGHYALDAAAEEYFDQLDVKNSSALVTSEYLKLMNKEALTFPENALVEFVLPTTAGRVGSLTLRVTADSGVKVFVRSLFQGPFEGDLKYQGFTPDVMPTLTVGDVYTSSDASLTGNFTYKGVANGMLLFDPPKTSGRPAGTLTKTSGNAASPASITYTSSTYAFDQSWYDQIGKPEGAWVELTGVGSSFTVPVAQIKEIGQYDKFAFRLQKVGGFSLSDLNLDWTGEEHKDYNFGRPQPLIDSRNAELLAQPLIGTSAQLAAWTVTGGALTPGASADTTLPVGSAGCVTLAPGVAVAQTISLAQETEYAREVVVEVRGRYAPPLYTPAAGNAPVSKTSFDYARVRVTFSNSSGQQIAVQERDFGLWWNGQQLRFLVPTSTANPKIKVEVLEKSLELDRVSVKLI